MFAGFVRLFKLLQRDVSVLRALGAVAFLVGWNYISPLNPAEEVLEGAGSPDGDEDRYSTPAEDVQTYYSLVQTAIEGDGSFEEPWLRLSEEFRIRNFDNALARYERGWSRMLSVEIEIQAYIEGRTRAEVHAIYTSKSVDGTGTNPYLYCMVKVDNIWKIDYVNVAIPCLVD